MLDPLGARLEVLASGERLLEGTVVPNRLQPPDRAWRREQNVQGPRSCRFKSGARNHLPANRSLGFCFEIPI
jgi:hypothetical protein